MNRQESHRIYLQLFAPHSSASQPKSGSSSDVAAAPILHRHGSHEIHPPNYPTTTPGAPYQFTSSSEHSSQSSYSFSSLSNTTPPTQHTRHPTNSQAIHSNSSTTIPQHRPSSQTKNRFVGYPSTVTTSAAVRLTDKAKTKDVTALLRGKFGLPPISSSSNDKNSSSGNNRSRKDESLSSYYSTQSETSKTMPTRLSQIQKDGNSRYSYSHNNAGGVNNPISTLLEAPKEDEDEIDALVIIGTIEGPPKGYLRFEHEEFLEEQQRLEVFRHFRSRQDQDERERLLIMGHPSRVREHSEDTVLAGNHQHTMKMVTEMAHLPVSESAATVQASGAQPGWASSMLLAPSASSEGTAIMHKRESDSNLSPLGGSGAIISSTTGAIGLDLSSSRNSSLSSSRNSSAGRGGSSNRTTPWGALRGIGAEGGTASQHGDMDFSSSRAGKLTTLVSELSASNHPSTVSPARQVEPALPSSPQLQPKSPSPCFEHDLEPIHIVRTVLPDEHPLQVRDDMMSLLSQLRQKSEDEMGLYLNNNEGEGGDFHRQYPQPTFRWYFQPCSPLGGIGSSSHSPKIQSIPAYIDVEGYCTDDESESDNDDKDDINSDDEGSGGAGGTLPAGETNQSKPIVSPQLIEERRRIAMLRDLADPSFLVSGYLLKQSWRDPNVWKRVYCVLAEDRMWTIGRMKPLKNVSADDMLSSLRVGRHKYIKLHRSLLLERGEGGAQSTKQYSSSKYSGYYLTPLDHRLPNTFRMITSHGKCHTFRAFNSQSFRVWVASLSEKIAQKHGDGMMDLANVIAEEETLARSRRMDDIAVTPLQFPSTSGASSNKKSGKSPILSMDIVRFGIAVAAFRELCRHVNDAIRQYNNQRARAVNVQTRVGGHNRMSRQQQPPSSPSIQRAKNMEHYGMVSSVWEDARMVASKSAQLLHALATLQHDELSKREDRAMSDSADENSVSPGRNIRMEELIGVQKGVQAILGKHWDHQHNNMDDTVSDCHFSLPPMQLFDPLLEKLQTALN